MPAPIFGPLSGRFPFQALLMVAVAASGILFFAPARGAEFVIHVSIDGLNSSLMQEVVDAGRAPALERLQAEAAWTANARTDYTHTVTLPNHTSMLTGRPVLQPAGMLRAAYHGWTDNSLPPRGATLHNMNDPHVGYVASVFDVVHDAGLSTALYVSKDKFIIYRQSYNATKGARGPHGRDKIGSYFYQDDGPPTYSAGMHRRFLADMSERHFHYSFVHYRDTDSAGHAFGWGSGAWRAALAAVDNYLAEMLRIVETSDTLSGRTAIIITTDHGGLGTDHNDATLGDDYTIPVIVWGAGVGRGDLYVMNADTRAEPGDSRPDYTAAGQPIRNGDTGNLALKLLGLGAIPTSTINAEQDLRVSHPGDFNLDGAVDAADYTVWRETQGSTSDLRADGNGDGVVDQADYDLWKANVGRP